VEQLIFVLFILFSLFTALMERRKRKRRAQPPAAPEQTRQRDPEVEEEEGGWPFPVDPFDLEPKKPQRVEMESTEAVDQEAREAEQRAQEMEQQVQELGRQAGAVQPRRRVEELVREKMAREQAQQAQPGKKRKDKRWKLDPQKARQAIVYAEILGLPKAERNEEF
jgi:flagellar biosynthesis/type III secretory pathway M-ring protein FliF/YscJ